MVASSIEEYVSLLSIPCLYEKPYATSHALYCMISFYSFHFHTKTHRYPIGFIFVGDWITSPNTFRLASDFNSVWIASFHCNQSCRCRHSFTFCGSFPSSLFMMSIATWEEKTSSVRVVL